MWGATGPIRTAKWKVLSLVPWHGDQVSPSFRKQNPSHAGVGERTVLGRLAASPAFGK